MKTYLRNRLDFSMFAGFPLEMHIAEIYYIPMGKQSSCPRIVGHLNKQHAARLDVG